MSFNFDSYYMIGGVVGTVVLVGGVLGYAIYKVYTDPHNMHEPFFNNLNNIQLDSMNRGASNSNMQDLVPSQVVESVSNVEVSNNLLETAPVYDYSTFYSLINTADAYFSHIVDGLHQYFIILNNVTLIVNLDLMNSFI